MPDNSNYTALTKPYERKIGKITFVISSFGNKNTAKTSGDLILQMLKNRISSEGGESK